MKIDDWMEETVSGTKSYSKRQLGTLLKHIRKDELIICAELSLLGRNLFMFVEITPHDVKKSKNENIPLLF